MHKENKKLSPMVFIIIGIILLLIGAFVFIIIKNPSTRTDFESFEEYKNSGAMTIIDIPHNATDIRYYNRDITIGKQSIYSFVISDDEDYNAFLKTIKEELHAESDGKKVSDYLTDDINDLYKFPLHSCFNEVIDDDLKEYEVIVYSPMGSGTNTYGIVVNEETRRFVVFRFATIR